MHSFVDMIWPLLSWIGQTLAGAAVLILAFIGVRSTAVGERFLSHHLDRKITELRNAHEEKIENLRTQLAHFQDRGRRANELEFEAITKIWRLFCDAWLKTQQAIVDYMSFPDMQQMSDEDVRAFLETTELSEVQKKQVLGAADKNGMFSKIMRLRRINAAGAAIFEGRLTLRSEGIFVPSALAQRFKEVFDKFSEAYVEQLMEFQKRGSGGFKKSLAILDTSGGGLIAEMEALLRGTIRRD
jgi:hypothetical protein